jgi:hypothetical protein
MEQTAVQQKIKRYDYENAEAALVILTNPQRWEGALTDWAQMVAVRLVATHPGRFPSLERAWAQVSYQLAFHATDVGRETVSQGDGAELSDLRAWHRR